jgi:hypothetical protein
MKPYAYRRAVSRSVGFDPSKAAFAFLATLSR